MQKYFSLFLLLALFPVVAEAQTLQNLLINFTKFLSTIIIPFLIAVAFFFFVVNAVRYFIIESTNETGREKAKALALYGVLAFVFIIIFWGIVNMIASSIGLQGKAQTTPDYLENAAFKNPTCQPGETSVCENVIGLTLCRCE